MSDEMNFQQKFNKIQTELIATKGQYNSFGKYKYRSCEDILEAIKPLLKETGMTLTITDEIIQIGERYYVKAMARVFDEKDGVSVIAYAREPEDKKGMDLSQITGATSSYARKYALNGLFCIDDNKDADTMSKEDNAEIKKEELKIDVKQEVLGIAAKRFKHPAEFKEWRIANNFPESMMLCTDKILNAMLEVLNDTV